MICYNAICSKLFIKLLLNNIQTCAGPGCHHTDIIKHGILTYWRINIHITLVSVIFNWQSLSMVYKLEHWSAFLLRKLLTLELLICVWPTPTLLAHSNLLNGIDLEYLKFIGAINKYIYIHIYFISMWRKGLYRYITKPFLQFNIFLSF